MTVDRLSRSLVGDFIDVDVVDVGRDGVWVVRTDQLPAEVTVLLVDREPTERRSGDRARPWIMTVDPDSNVVRVTTDAFGNLPISDGMRARYRLALWALTSRGNGAVTREATSNALSEFKGMVNRCLRQDQRDWATVFRLLGSPPHEVLHEAAAEIAKLRSSPDADPVAIAPDSQIRRLAERAFADIDAERPRLPGSRSLSHAGLETVPTEPSRRQVELDLEKTRKARAAHAATLALLRAHLEAMGFVVEENIHIDAYARLPARPAIFEVKSVHPTNEVAQVREAISQLYEYRYRYEPKAALWIVLSGPLSLPNAWMADYLEEDRGIGLLWLDDSSELTGPGLERLTETRHGERLRLRTDTQPSSTTERL